MKVFVVNYVLNSSGSAHWLKKYIGAFPENDYYVLSKKKGRDEAFFKENNIKYYSFSIKILDFLLSPIFSLFICMLKKPDVVLLNTSVHGLDALLLRAFGIKFFTVVHEDISNYHGSKKLPLIKLSIKHSNKLICISRMVLTTIKNYKPKYVGKTFLVENYLNEEDILAKSQENNYDAKFQEFLSRNKGGTLFCSVGLFNENKNVLRMLDLIYTVNGSSLILIGDFVSPNLAKKFEDKIILLGLTNRVHVTKVVSNPYKYMKYSDVSLIFSDYETFSYSLYESLLLQLPVIANNIPVFPVELERCNVSYIDISNKDIDFEKLIFDVKNNIGNSEVYKNLHPLSQFRVAMNDVLS